MSIKLKTFSVFLSVMMAIGLMGVMTPSAGAITIAELQAQILALQAQLEALQGTPSTGYTFSADLKMGSTGDAVKQLQIMLNKDAATQVAASGVGSAGSETEYFGPLTKAAVIKFQNKYASEILTPIGLTAGTGYVGSMTRAKLNALYGGGVTTPETPATPSVGTGLTVAAGTQPAASLAPYGATRIPFTVVSFTASSDGDVTINSLVVERTGLAVDAVFSGIILLDENGLQIGLEKTLNSVHQATLSEAFTVKAGQTRTLTLAGNRAAQGTHGGEIAYLSLVSVNTSAAVNGTLPITGTGQTINETLVVGALTNTRGPLDPGTTATKEVGTTGYTFSSIKITAGSAEKVRLLSIRWNQSGSAAKDDLANVKTYIDGTAYDAVVSADGKYYTSTFDGGIVIDKGFSKEIYVKSDIVSGSARTIDFDIYKTTDLYLKGETYGYGISGATSGTGFSTGQPWYNASAVTVSAGTLNVSKATSVASQNITINLANQPLGGYEVEAKGEPVSVTQMVFTIASTTGSGYGLLTNVSLFDENGAVVAGPVDGVQTTTPANQTVTFTDTVTFPVGKHIYTLEGKVASTIGNDGTYITKTTPANQWTDVKGQNTGDTIYVTPSSEVAASTMTVKGGALGVSVSAIPLAQTVIAGSSQFLFANYVLDAGNSGEDVSLNSFKASYDVGGGTDADAQMLTSCKIYDGSNILTTGSNIKNPAAAALSTTFTFDAPLIITKGTSKTLGLKCDVAGSANGQVWRWGYNATDNDLSPVGKISGQDITESGTTSIGQAMTASTAGAYTVVDDSSPGYTVVSAGTTGVTLLKLKFAAVNEAIDINRVAFQLAGVASNTPLDLADNKVTLYDSAAPTVAIATAEFSTSDFATSTSIASGAFTIPSGGYKTLLVKGDISAISGTVGPLKASGDLLRVGYDGTDVNTTTPSSGGNYGKGVSSGTSIAGSTTDVNATGVRIMKAYPTFAKIAVPSTTLVAGDMDLYRFSIATNPDTGNGIGLHQLTVNIATSTGNSVSGTTTVTNIKVYAYTDSSFSSPVSGYDNGQVVATIGGLVSSGDNDAQLSSILKIPSGSTYYFKVRGTVTLTSGSGTFSGSVTTKINGDTAYPSLATTMMGAQTSVDGTSQDNLVWSPNSTTTSVAAHVDWTNGYYVSGLPSDGMDSVTIWK